MVDYIMDTIQNLRKYRLGGIALFDLISSFIGAYILDYYFDLSYVLFGKLTKNFRIVYYLSIIPIGVITHIIFSQETFLNKQLFSSDMNVYKIIMMIIIFGILYNL